MNTSFDLLPVGGIAYHGSHGVQGTDSLLARRLSQLVAERYDATLLPSLDYTLAPKHVAGYPGYVHTNESDLLALLAQLFADCFESGSGRLVVLNAHSDSQFAAFLAAEKAAAQRRGRSCLIINWWKVLPVWRQPRDLELGSSGGHGHGGPLEMSVAWAVEPSAKPEIASVGRSSDVSHDLPWWKPAAHVAGEGQSPLGWRGYQNSPSRASTEKGDRLVEDLMTTLSTIIENWLEREDGIGYHA